MIIGITGSLASGKTTVTKQFQESFGIPYFSVDDAIREVMRTPDVKDLFGSLVGDEEDSRDAFIKNPKKMDKLENAVYPVVDFMLDEWIKNQETEACVVDYPLLFEKEFDKKCDIVITVHCTEPVRTARYMDRIQGNTKSHYDWLDLHNKRQWSQQKKVKFSDFEINTNGGIDNNVPQIQDILVQLRVVELEPVIEELEVNE